MAAEVSNIVRSAFNSQNHLKDCTLLYIGQKSHPSQVQCTVDWTKGSSTAVLYPLTGHSSEGQCPRYPIVIWHPRTPPYCFPMHPFHMATLGIPLRFDESVCAASGSNISDRSRLWLGDDTIMEAVG
jgi:hypothetical protein